MSRNDLIKCFQDTMNIANGDTLSNMTKKAQQTNKIYMAGFVSKNRTFKESADIIVEENTTFAAAKKYSSLGKVAVLNFANPETPGGGVENGAMAQEECLCRSSNLYACLKANNVWEDYYKYHRELRSYFYSDRVIYTKDITVYKDDSEIPVLMEKSEWFNVDVITCAAPYLAKQRHTNKTALKELFKSRIKNILEVACDNNVDVIILGAFGCGAFKNPPEIVAKAFNEVIKDYNYDKSFKKIVFAIKRTSETPCPNLMAFELEICGLSPEANLLRFSDPYPLEQAFGEVHMSSGRVLRGGKEFNTYFDWQRTNKYCGKQFSILGDSISTLEGYNPSGYKLFYTGDTCEKSRVFDMKDTWWGKVIDFFGGELLVNNSWSGSRVTKLPTLDKLFPSGCSNERTSSLHINNVKPDVIIVYLGTNDWAFGAKTGNDTVLLDEDEMELFGYAYERMLGKIRENYPNSEIWCCTISETFMSNNPRFKFPHKYAGIHIEEYNDIIRNVVRKNKCKIIDLYNFKIPYDSIDGSHPTIGGMSTIAMMVIRTIAGQEADKFLDCENAKHDYVVSEQYTGGTKYVCTKCAKVIHTTTLFPPQEITIGAKITEQQGYNRSRYVWGDRQVSGIRIANLSWGNLPIYNIDVEDNIVRLYKKINGSRDGCRTFPDGFFDEKKKTLDVEEKRRLFQFLDTIDFAKWKTNDTTIANIENMSAGFCVTESFQCVFDDGTAFYCANPPQSQFKELIEYFKNFFPGEKLEQFYPNVISADEKKSVLVNNNITENSEYVMSDSDITTILYSDILRLTFMSTGKMIQIQKDKITVGREQNCDLFLGKEKQYIARNQATFLFEHGHWYLQDNNSTNGTWINGVKLQSKKKYQLAANDVIDFAHSVRMIFYKSESHGKDIINEDNKIIDILNSAMKIFSESNYKDEIAYKIIISALSKAPLYFPVEIDIEAMLGNINPSNLKPGDTIETQKDVKLRIQTITLKNGIELIPMFTSQEEINGDVSAVRYYPQDYLPMIVKMDRDIVINPFDESRFVLDKSLIENVLIPMVENEVNNEVKQDADKEENELIGTVVGEKYNVIKEIAQGGFFKMYLVRDENNKTLAMKVCNKTNKYYTPEIYQSIMQEPHIMMKMNHPAIPKVVDVIEDNKYIFIVREYIEGETLKSIITKEGPQAAEKVIEWGKQLCDVLQYLHTLTPSHIYRDMKPGNIILQPDGKLKLIDFGLVRMFDLMKDRDTCFLGTKGYAAPEQYGSRQSDARTDIFGLGMTMHHLVTGVDPSQPPYETKPIRKINMFLPKGLEYIISKCIKLNPDNRYQSCDELLADLNDYQNLPKGFISKLFK